MDSTMELRHLRYFLAVADEGHFGRAAERLHIVQPALSMQIRALETELGAPLFVRTSRRVTLTEAGALLRVEAERTLQQAERAKAVVERAARGEIGTVRIGFVANASFAGKLSTDIAAFKRAHPHVDLELTEMYPLPQMEAILAGRLDVGYSIDIVEQSPHGLEVAAIAAWPWIVAMSASHPLARRKTVSAKLLAEEAFVVYAADTEDDSHVGVLRQLLGREPREVHRVPNTLAVVTLAAAGMGLALVPASVTTLNLPDVAYRPLDAFRRNYTLMLLSRRDEPSPAIRRFIDIARSSPG
jgi:DNA-binding transcriptional LysR family regulator